MKNLILKVSAVVICTFSASLSFAYSSIFDWQKYTGIYELVSSGKDNTWKCPNEIEWWIGRKSNLPYPPPNRYVPIEELERVWIDIPKENRSWLDFKWINYPARISEYIETPTNVRMSHKSQTTFNGSVLAKKTEWNCINKADCANSLYSGGYLNHTFTIDKEGKLTVTQNDLLGKGYGRMIMDCSYKKQ